VEAILDAGGKGKVLVMDDEEMVRAVVGEMLKTVGHEVECARDGKEAIALFIKARESENPFSAVIVDLNVPDGMGGRETVERLREIDSNVKAVVSSGYTDDPILMNYREYGFQAVISKPFRVSELNDALLMLDCDL
jgi:two-component system cell cycle sensor histidine kinase/response regulator CckA